MAAKDKTQNLSNMGKGRPKGVPNATTKALKDMVIAALMDVGGEKYLAEQAVKNPAAFLSLLGRILPLQLTGDAAAPITVQIVRFGVDA
jgi:hypothetical protein